MNKHNFPKSILAFVLALCMVFGCMSNALVASAAEVDDEYVYVAFGDSTTNGYGMIGYWPQNNEDNNVRGYMQQVQWAYPSLVKAYLEEQGETVDLRQMAVSGFRAEELRVLLDNDYEGDDYTKRVFSGGENWYAKIATRSGIGSDVNDLREAYQDAVADADLISIDIGLNNFGTYVTSQIMAALNGEEGDTPDFTRFADEETLAEVAELRAEVEGILAESMGVTSLEELVGTEIYGLLTKLVDAVAYGYLGFATDFDASIASIRELNPDAKIIILGLYNTMVGTELLVPGTENKIPVGEIWGACIDVANLYTSTLSPCTEEYLYADPGQNIHTFADQLIEAANGTGEIGVNLKSVVYGLLGDELENNATLNGVYAIVSSFDADLKAEGTSAEAVNAAIKEAAMDTAVDVAVEYLGEIAANQVIDMTALVSGQLDFDTLSEQVFSELANEIAQAVTQAVMGVLADPEIVPASVAMQIMGALSSMVAPMAEDGEMTDEQKSLVSLYIRFYLEEGLFIHPDEAGYQQMADAVIEVLETNESADLDEVMAEFNALMEKALDYASVYAPVVYEKLAAELDKILEEYEVEANLKNAITELKQEIAEAKKDADAATLAALEKLEAALDALESKVNSAIGEALGELSDAIADLKDILANAGSEGGAAIQDAVEHAYAAMDKLIEAIETAKSDIGAAIEDVEEALAEAKAAMESTGEAGKEAYEAIEGGVNGFIARIEELQNMAFVADYEANDDSKYVAIGDSLVTGMGLEGYSNNGYQVKVPGAYPALLTEALGLDPDTQFEQLACGGLRVEDIRYILDETFAGDEYIDEVTLAKLDKNTGGLEKARADFEAAITDADLITVQMGGNNFGTYIGAQTDRVLAGEEPYQMYWDEFVNEDVIDAIHETQDAVMASLMALTDNDEAILSAADTICTMVEAYVYGYVGFAGNYSAVLDRIHEMNPDAQIVVVGLYNTVDELYIEFEEYGVNIDAGELVDVLIDVINLHFASYAASCDYCIYVEVPDTEMFADSDNHTASHNLADLIEVDGALIPEYLPYMNAGNGLASHPNANGHEYIKDQILGHLNVTRNFVELESISVKTEPKTEFIVGDKFDTTGLVVVANYTDGSSVEITDYTVAEPDMTKIGEQEVVISYEGLTTSYTVNVKENSVVAIKVTPPTKTEFYEGHEFDATGMVVEALYANGTVEVVTDYTISAPDMTKVGEQEVTVSYEGQSDSFTITVLKVEVYMEFINLPEKLQYIQGEEFDPTGVGLTVIYTDGSSEKFELDYDEPDMNQVGAQKVRFYLGDRDFFITINIAAKSLTKITLTPPTKTDYLQGEELDTTGMVVTAYFDNGKSEAVTDYTLSDVDMMKTGKQTVTVTYGNQTATFEINITKMTLADLAIIAPGKCYYVMNEKLNTEGLKVYAVYDSGVKQEIKEGYTISTVDMSKPGKHSVAVSFGGKTADFTIQVIPYNDVEVGSWYYDSAVINYVRGLIVGTGNYKFSPKMDTSRAMIATILYRMAGSPEVKEAATYTDVRAGSWYSDAIAWAEDTGVVFGYGNGKFGPNDPITREQMATMMYRFAKVMGYDISYKGDLSQFPDANKISAWAKDAMVWANGAGLIVGTKVTKDTNKIDPQGSAIRSQASAIIYRFCELNAG